MNFKQCLVVALPALLCGALLGYLAAPAAVPETEEETIVQSEAKPTRKAARASTDEAALERLRSRIQELEKQLAAQSSAQAGEEKVDVAEKRPSRREGGEGDFQARMEEWRKNNPEQYAQMTNRFAQMRAEHIQRVQNRLEVLASVNTTHMNPKQKETHARYQELLAQQTELRDALRPGSGTEMNEQQRNKARERLHSLDQQVSRLANEERNTLLTQTALNYGVKGANAKEAVETIKAIYQATEGEWGGGRGWGGRGPGGGRGGRGGRR